MLKEQTHVTNVIVLGCIYIKSDENYRQFSATSGQ